MDPYDAMNQNNVYTYSLLCEHAGNDVVNNVYVCRLSCERVGNDVNMFGDDDVVVCHVNVQVTMLKCLVMTTWWFVV